MAGQVLEEAQKVVADYWDSCSEGFDAEHDTEDLSLWREELERAIGRKGDGKVLDIGTGTGFLALLAAGLGYQVTGIDLSEKMMGIGKQKAAARKLSIDFVKGACESLPFPDGSFDAVVNCRVMWTLTEPVAAIQEWMRVLKHGGKVISFMRMMEISEDEVREYYGEGITLPLRNSTREAYIQAYQEAGLSDVRAIELPPEMSSADMPGWTVFIGSRQ